MTAHKEYKIEKITDLLQLDNDQLERCLTDLRTWVTFRKKVDQAVAIAKGMAIAAGCKPEDIEAQTQDHMAWIDDGIEGGAVNFSITDKQTGKVEFAERFAIDASGDISVA